MARIKIATAKIYLNIYEPDQFGKCIVSIKITYDRKRRYYDWGVRLTVGEYTEMFSPDANPGLGKILKEVKDKESKALSILNTIKNRFSFDAFESRFYEANVSNPDLFIDAFKAMIDAIDTDQGGTIAAYGNARNSFRKFRPKATIYDLTPQYFRDYEKWMLSGDKPKSHTTIGMYCRAARALINALIDSKRLTVDDYPFGHARKKKYEIPTGSNIKKALDLDEIGKIYRFECEVGSNIDMCRDYWMFLYLANGINAKDFCLLKWTDIKSNHISFVREKTKRTKKVVEPITVMIQPEMRDIIEKWGDKDGYYIFKCLDKNTKGLELRKAVQLLIALINDNMKRIAKELNISKQVTTYYARHSFATILNKSGAPLLMTSKALGHSSIATTERYLAGFTEDELKDATDALRKF